MKPSSRAVGEPGTGASVDKDEDWAGEVVVYHNQEEIDRALGTGRQNNGLLSIWWD